jgi:hypothetical protein
MAFEHVVTSHVLFSSFSPSVCPEINIGMFREFIQSYFGRLSAGLRPREWRAGVLPQVLLPHGYCWLVVI